MSQKKAAKSRQCNKDQIVKYRCDRPLILDFDKSVQGAKKTRSQVLRELMAGWVEQRKSA